MMQISFVRRLRAPLSLLSLAAVAAAQDGMPAVPMPATDAIPGPYSLSIVHVNTAGHPTNVVPGLGVPFVAGGGAASAFGRPTLSASGSQFAIKAVANTGSTATGDVILRNGALLVQEGTQAPWAPVGENTGTIDEEFGINSAGDLLLGNNTAPTSTNDDYIALFAGGTWTVLAQEAGSITPTLPLLTGTWDDDINSPRMLDTGATVWRAAGIDGMPGGTANDALVVLGGGLAVQKGVDIPTGQAGGGTAAWEIFDADDAYVSPDGLVYLIQGDLTGATTSDDVLVMNGAVVIQEGTVLPGSSFAANVTNVVKPWVDHAGAWYARGNNTGGDDWVVRNGVVVADSSGTFEVVPGSGEHWTDAEFTDCFFAFDGNAAGQFVVAGVTDAPTATNGVIAFYDGAGYVRVVAREGDPIDLDGNGLFDDDRFLNTIGNDDVLLRDDGTVVFVATLRTGAGAAVDQGLFELQPKVASCTLRNGSNLNPVQCTAPAGRSTRLRT
jgi:hypothetical protein